MLEKRKGIISTSLLPQLNHRKTDSQDRCKRRRWNESVLQIGAVDANQPSDDEGGTCNKANKDPNDKLPPKIPTARVFPILQSLRSL